MKHLTVFERAYLKPLQMLVLLCALLLPLIPTSVRAQAVEYVVFSIEGTISDLSLGQILNEGDRIMVPKNTALSLISKQGEIVTLEGPTTATVTTEAVDAAGEKALVSISNLLFDDSKFVKTLGGTRSTDNETNVQKLLLGQAINQAWLPILSEITTYCVKEGDIAIRRETANEDIFLSQEPASNNNKIRWEAGIYVLDLSELLTTNNETHTLSIGSEEKKITLFISKEQNNTIVEQVAWMARKGCVNQALLLLASKTPSPE